MNFTAGALSLVLTSDISIRTRWKRKRSVISPQGLEKIKEEFFFVSSFVRLLAYAWTMILCWWSRRSLCRRLDFIPLFCLLFRSYAYICAHLFTKVLYSVYGSLFNKRTPWELECKVNCTDEILVTIGFVLQIKAMNNFQSLKKSRSLRFEYVTLSFLTSWREHLFRERRQLLAESVWKLWSFLKVKEDTSSNQQNISNRSSVKMVKFITVVSLCLAKEKLVWSLAAWRDWSFRHETCITTSTRSPTFWSSSTSLNSCCWCHLQAISQSVTLNLFSTWRK